MEPTRFCLCGINLRTGVSLLIALDLFRGVTEISKLAGDSVAGNFSFLNFAIYLSSIIFGFSAIYGLNKNKASYITLYAISFLLRVAISISLSIWVIYHLDQISADQVDALIAAMNAAARSEHRPAPVIDREQAIQKLKVIITSWTVFSELFTDLFCVYFAYVVRSLAVWMERGERNPGHQGLYHLAMPIPDQSSVAGFVMPLLHGQRAPVPAPRIPNIRQEEAANERVIV